MNDTEQEDLPSLQEMLYWLGDASLAFYLTPWYKVRERFHWKAQIRYWRREAANATMYLMDDLLDIQDILVAGDLNIEMER